MSRKILMILILMILVSCSILTQDLSGSQQIRVRLWKNHTPNFLELKNAVKDKLLLDVRAENVVEFDTQIIGNTVYVAYTADRIVHTALDPEDTLHDNLDADLGVGFVDDLIAGSVPDDKIFKYQIVQTPSKKQHFLYREKTVPGKDPVTNFEIIHQTTELQRGVWLRVLKGTIKGNERNPTGLSWESIIDHDTPMAISDITFVSLERQEATLVAVSNNNKVVVLNDVDQNEVLNFISSDLLRKNYNNISQLNSWRDGNKTYISVVADSTLITGFYKDLLWTKTYAATFRYPIRNMRVESGMEFAYGIWINGTTSMLHVAMYNGNYSSSRQWLEIDRLSSIKQARLNVVTYTDPNNVIRERAFLGAVDEQRNFFQLFTIQNLDTAFAGPIISDWNERYAIAPNTLGQVLYIRANFDHTLGFSGLSSLNTWTSMPISPHDDTVKPKPHPRINPQSEIDSYFLNIFYNLTIYKQENGSIYFLGAIR